MTSEDASRGNRYASSALAAFALLGLYQVMAGVVVQSQALGFALYNVLASTLALVACVFFLVRWQPGWRYDLLLGILGLAGVAFAWSAGALPVADTALLLAAVSFGKLLALLFREPNLLLPAALVGGTVDLLSVYFGPTGAVVQHLPKLLSAASSSAGAVAAHVHFHGKLISFSPVDIGAGDLLFLSLFLALAWRFDLGYKAMALSLFCFASLGIILASVQARPIPGLVWLGLGAIVVSLPRLKFKRQEVYAILVLGLVLLLLLGWALAHGTP